MRTLKFFKIDPLKLDVEMIESKISRPFARKHRMTPVAVRDGKLIVAVVNPFDTVALDTYHQMVKQEIEIVVVVRERRDGRDHRAVRLPRLGDESRSATSAAARSISATSSSTSS